MEDRFNHPIFQPQWLKFCTPSVIALDNVLKKWIRCGVTGGVILGNAREGKTTAIEMLANSYKTVKNAEKISGHIQIMTLRDKPTIKSCHSSLLISTKIKIKISYGTEKMFEQLLDFFCDLANENSSASVILFVDEFQRLLIDQVNVYADLQNFLRSRGVTLYVYFIGNRLESTSLLEHAEKEEYSHLKGRFFEEIFNFSGIRNQAELATVLSIYDSLRFPEDGPTYTEFFLPNEFRKGWRLQSAAAQIWKTYQECVTGDNRSNWGMRYLVATINPLLTDYLVRYSVEKLNSKMVERCLQISGLKFERKK